jgi:glycosyltransferase involved in cell wall biosynthesis
MALANCFILPSVSEPWGLVVNEAMACGLPVLVSDRCGCCPELVKGDVNGWTFDPCSESALVDLMVRMTGMPEPRRAQLGQASQAIVAEWGLERHARSLFDAADYALRLRRGTTG